MMGGAGQERTQKLAKSEEILCRLPIPSLWLNIHIAITGVKTKLRQLLLLFVKLLCQ